MKSIPTLQTPSIELAHILDEVKQNGFYATKLDAFLPEIRSQHERMYMICLMASKLDLKVNFNFDETLCVLEQK